MWGVKWRGRGLKAFVVAGLYVFETILIIA